MEIISDGKTTVFHRDEVGSDVVLRIVTESCTTSQKYLVVKHRAAAYTQESRRPGAEETDIVLAFPVTDDEGPIVEDQALYAYLPLRRYGFKVRLIADSGL